jgi:hypothetical protein
MDTFLDKLVTHLCTHDETFENISIILPNQRAGVYLKSLLKKQLKSTTFLPKIYTFDSFVEYITEVVKTPKIELLFLLYNAYQKITPPQKQESFEVFSTWGKTVLEDFNTIDINVVSPEKIFEKLKVINQIHNWEPNTEISKNYLIFLQDLMPLYTAYQSLLIEKNKAYQGMLFKRAIGELDHFSIYTHEKIIFAGFSAFKNAEWVIVKDLIDKDKATLFWYIPHVFNQIFHKHPLYSTITDKQWSYGLKIDTQSSVSSRNITITGVSQKIGMVKYASELLKNQVYYSDTSVVLLNPKLLSSVLQSIPAEIDRLNVTMGMPLQSFGLISLLKAIIHLHKEQRNNPRGFYYKNILHVVEHPMIFTYVNGAEKLIEKIKIRKQLYFTTNELNTLCSQFIVPMSAIMDGNRNSHPIEFIKNLSEFWLYLKTKLSKIDKEVLFHLYKINNQLLHWTNQYEIEMSWAIVEKIYMSALYTEQLNFLGEPIQGLQIMGLLETQNLPLKNVILIQGNEGYLPENNQPLTYIPADVLKEFDIPGVQFTEWQYGYIFSQLIASAEHINFIYNTDNDTFGQGEISRYLKHLLWLYPEIPHNKVKVKTTPHPITLKEIAKNTFLKTKLKDWFHKGVSPSALSLYVYNPIAFYNRYILEITEVDEISETIAENIMGSVVHDTLEKLYKPYINKTLSIVDLESLLPKIPKLITHFFTTYYREGILDTGLNLLITNVSNYYVKRFILHEIKEIKEGNRIKILSLEDTYTATYKGKKLPFPITFKGKIDRIDQYNETLRIIDYKTGRVAPADLSAARFETKMDNYKKSKTIQVLLYAYLYRQNTQEKPKNFKAGIVSFKNFGSGFIPVTFENKQDTSINDEKLFGFLETLEHLILEILDIEKNFVEKPIQKGYY